MTPLVRARLRLLLVYSALFAPFLVYGASRTLSSNFNSPLAWVPASYPPKQRYDSFCKSFGPGDSVIASWEGCFLDDERLDVLAHKLRNDATFYDSDATWMLHRVVTGRELFRVLTAGPPRLSHEQAVDRLRGTLVGLDSRTTCIVVHFAPNGLRRREELVRQIQRSIEAACGVAPNQQHLAGPVIDGLSVDVASRSAMERLAMPSAAIILLAACVCLRSARMGLLVFGLSVIAQVSTLAMVHFCGQTMSALLIVLPPLIQVLAVAGGVHLANYFTDASAECGAASASDEALRRGWLPCVLSFGTTAAGVGSLLLSQVSPIRQFGCFSAAGVVITAVLLLVPFPLLLAVSSASWPQDVGRRRQSARGGAVWHCMAHVIHHGHAGVLGVSILLTLVTAVGLAGVTTSVRIETLFDGEHTLVKDYAWLESHVGSLVPIEIVLNVDAGSELPYEDRMKLLWHVNEAVCLESKIRGTFSTLTFLPPFPARASLTATAFSQAVHENFTVGHQLARTAGYETTDELGHTMRLSAYVSAMGNDDYEAILDSLTHRIQPILREKLRPAAGVTADCTGIMPLVQAIQGQLLDDLFKSFSTAFAVIAVVMTVAQAGIARGLILMIPNVFPTLVLFGTLGWTETPLDIGTIMTASIALGIAVDDTLHYVTCFCATLSAGESRLESVKRAYRQCGPAMSHTSIICALGLAVFAWTDFVPAQRFAWTMAALIGLALAGDLVLLPALLLGPAGRLFESVYRPVEERLGESPAPAGVEPPVVRRRMTERADPRHSAGRFAERPLRDGRRDVAGG